MFGGGACVDWDVFDLFFKFRVAHPFQFITCDRTVLRAQPFPSRRATAKAVAGLISRYHDRSNPGVLAFLDGQFRFLARRIDHPCERHKDQFGFLGRRHAGSVGSSDKRAPILVERDWPFANWRPVSVLAVHW